MIKKFIEIMMGAIVPTVVFQVVQHLCTFEGRQLLGILIGLVVLGFGIRTIARDRRNS
jgi:hypothetical protein